MSAGWRYGSDASPPGGRVFVLVVSLPLGLPQIGVKNLEARLFTLGYGLSTAPGRVNPLSGLSIADCCHGRDRKIGNTGIRVRPDIGEVVEADKIADLDVDRVAREVPASCGLEQFSRTMSESPLAGVGKLKVVQ